MNTLLRIRRKSLDLNSLRAERWRRSIKSSPLRSTTCSWISSVVKALISFNSSSFFDIFTGAIWTARVHWIRGGQKWAILIPWKDDDFEIRVLGKGEKLVGEAAAMEKLLNIFLSFCWANGCSISVLFYWIRRGRGRLGRLLCMSNLSFFLFVFVMLNLHKCDCIYYFYWIIFFYNWKWVKVLLKYN